MDESSATPIYERRIVAYLDLLGFRAFVNSCPAEQARHAEQALQALNAVRMDRDLHAAVRHHGLSQDVRLSMFSDSIAITAPLTSGVGASANSIILNVRRLFLRMFRFGVPIRGAITIGQIYHNDPVIFGPALIAAVEEEQRAIYPRVVVSDDVVGLATSTSGASREQAFNQQFARDRDGQQYIRMFVADFEHFFPPSPSPRSLRETFHGPMLQIANRYLTAAPEGAVKQKWNWLISDIEEHADVFGARIITPRGTGAGS